MKNLALVVGLMFFGASAEAAAVKEEYYNIPFKSVDYWGGDESLIVFRDALVYKDRSRMNVVVDIDSVQLLPCGQKNTTISAYPKKDKIYDIYFEAKFVKVFILNEDLPLWRKFLDKVRKEQERERQRKYLPTRVLPPQ